MIELTPLDVRKKRGDFRKGMRGYDPGEVDSFMELVAERLETLVKENLTLKERTERLGEQVKDKQDRERAVQEALVTAQALRKDISGQAQREAELMRREAEAEIERMLMDAENRLDELRLSMDEIDRRRRRFLRAVRAMLERELDFVGVEEGRDPLADKPLELELFIPRSEGEVDVPRPWEREGVPAPKGELLGADEEPLPSSSPAWQTADSHDRVSEPEAEVPVAAASIAVAPEVLPGAPAASESAQAAAPASPSRPETAETDVGTPTAAEPAPQAVSPATPALEDSAPESAPESSSRSAPPSPSSPSTDPGAEGGTRRWEPHWRFTLGEGGTKDASSE